MAIYDEELQKLPTETLQEYLLRLKQLRGGSILGTSGMMDMPTPGEQRQAREQREQAGVAKEGQQVVRPLTDAQMAAQAERESGMSDYEREQLRDTPEKQAARREAALNKHISIALGNEPGISNLDAAGGMLALGGTLPFGVASLGLGGFADWYERDTAALALGRALGTDDVEKAKEIGYGFLDNPERLQTLIDSGRLSYTPPEKREKTIVERILNFNLFGDDDDNTGVDGGMTSNIASIGALINSSGGMFQPTSSNSGTNIGYVPPSQQSTVSPGTGGGAGFTLPVTPTLAKAVAALPSYSAPALPSDSSDSSPSGGGTPLSEVQGTTDYANANQDAAYEAMGGFYY